MRILSRSMLFVPLICTIVSISATESGNQQTTVPRENATEQSNMHHGAILGRFVQIPARDYILAFGNEVPKLGDCALNMEDGIIKTCTEKFGGNEVFIPKASTNVDMAKVRSAEDVMNYGMGGIAVHAGVLGLIGAGLKTNMASTIQMSDRHLTLMTSYDLQKGLLTLQHAYPVTETNSDGTLYLSEIEFGGNEILMVAMEFETIEQKTEVEKTLTVNVLFKTISDKMKYITDNFNFLYKTRAQFKSSWRPHVDNTYSSADEATAEVERLETMIVDGPTELNDMDIADSRVHNNYYFAAWNRSPYGEHVNMAVINNELDNMRQQNLEVQATIYRISELSELHLNPEKLAQFRQLNSTVRNISERLSRGIETYHRLSENERIELRNIYGDNKAPQYYARQLKNIVGY